MTVGGAFGKEVQEIERNEAVLLQGIHYFCFCKRIFSIIKKTQTYFYRMKRVYLTVAALWTAMPAAAQSRPNIVVVLADDLGYGDVGFHGSNIKTPNVDQLAEEGVVLNRFYTAPVSSPTRAGFLTGRYPNRFGLRETVIPPWRDFGLDVEEETLADMLGEAGYVHRAMIGKWHLGHSRREYYPLERGFTHFYGHLNGALDYFTHKREGQLDWHRDWAACYDVGYSTDLITAEAVKCIDSYAKGDEPFFLYVAYNAPHTPLQAKTEDIALYTDNFEGLTDEQKKRATYSAMVTCLDRGVGEIRKALQTNDIEDNTLFIFFSDNGGEPNGPASNAPLRGNKYQEFDGGVRTPAVVSWPAEWPGRRTVEQVVGFVDLMPTIRNILQIRGKPKRDFDGLDISALLSGEIQGLERDFYLGCGAVVNNNYKLIQKGKNSNVNIVNDYFLCYYPQNPYEEKNLWSNAENNVHRDEIDRLKGVIGKYDAIQSPFVLPPYNEGQDGFTPPFEWNVDYYLKEYTYPYPVSNYGDFMAIRNNLDGEYYLANDIEIPPDVDWLPLGATSPTDADPQWFTGILDGRGYSIKNLVVSTRGRFKGLFSRLNRAEVRNLNLVNVTIKGTTTVGGVSGVMMGGSKIERISVSGTIEGETEVGGVVGRIARNPTYTDYNTIYDCFVRANIKATSLSTDMNAPSCAGGIAAFSHSVSGNSVAKIDIRRVYVTGSIISEQKDHVAGNAAGILAFFDNHNFVKMEEVIVLADTIGSATSNLFFSRRGYAYNELELFDKVYARTGIALNYLSSADKGPGGQIPAGIIACHPAETYQTKQFYINNLSWDFNKVWDISEGQYPVLRKSASTTQPKSPTADAIAVRYNRPTHLLHIDPQVADASDAMVRVFSMSGATLFRRFLGSGIAVSLPAGVYGVTAFGPGINFGSKVVVY
jgi:arylsulfatase B